MRAVDLSFYRFMRRVYGQETGVSLGSDLLTIGLDSVAAVTGTHLLAAGAGTLTGGRDAYRQQVLSVSLPLLFEEMIANRRELLLRIRQAETRPVSAYSLFQALSDIDEYEVAGSIPNAAAELAASAGSNARSSQARLEAQRSASAAQQAALTLPQATYQSAPAQTATPTTAPAGVDWRTTLNPPPPPGATSTTTTLNPPPPPSRTP